MRKIIIFFILFLLLVAVPATVYLVFQNQELRKRATPATTLSLSPANTSKKVGDEFSLNVNIDTGENQVVAAELHILYDATKLEVLTFTNGPLFPSIIASFTQGDLPEGRIASLTVGASNTTPVKGTGQVASLKFKALAATASPISVKFTANNIVAALGEGGKNVLIQTNPATVNIGESASTTPTVSLTPTLTPTPTATASGNATSSAEFAITSPEENSSTSAQPQIIGKAPPGSTITVTIYSTQQTYTITADSNGNWILNTTSPLDSGPHEIVATAIDPTTGQTFTLNGTLVVASGEEGNLEEAMPIAGNLEYLWLLTSLSVFFITSGLILNLLNRKYG